jgi:hypothetical protein
MEGMGRAWQTKKSPVQTYVLVGLREMLGMQ